MVCKDIIDAASVICQQASRAAHPQPATRPASEPAISPASPQLASTVSSIWDPAYIHFCAGIIYGGTSNTGSVVIMAHLMIFMRTWTIS